MAVPVNGQHISSVGGVVQFAPFNATGAPSTTGAFDDTLYPFLDVGRWSLNGISFVDDTTDTGCFGGQGIDIANQGGTFQLDIIWDQTKPPDIIARDPVAIIGDAGLNNMNLGAQVSLFVGNYLNYPEADVVSQEWYFIPSGKVFTINPVNDANSKKMVRMQIVGIINGLYFHMPYDNVRLANYKQHCINRGRTW